MMLVKNGFWIDRELLGYHSLFETLRLSGKLCSGLKKISIRGRAMKEVSVWDDRDHSYSQQWV
jgi:hypothetical protein